ncbi:MAG: NAD(P)-dependent oxidoreductase [Alphaproteobacteria bacterium]
MAGPGMLKFVTVSQAPPEKRAAETRRHDFDEIYQRFATDKVAVQAARCSQCGVPFCQVHCPLHNNIPDWLMLTAAGRLEEAAEIASATNAMPEICGRICPQDRLCEGNCVIERAGHGTVTIGAIEKYILDTAWEKGWIPPLHPGAATGKSVGIIGAGPAGLAAAEQLRIKGHDVHIYDRYDRMGGLLVYGIPNFKLEKDVVARRTERLAAGGVVYHPRTNVGTTVSFAHLRQRHDAILIATGVYKPRDIEAPGVGLKGIIPALEYLIASNRKGFGDPVAAFDEGPLNAAGKKVVVIGGGDTAMDCVRTAVRQGAASVTCLYRRNRENMPGSQREVSYAIEEGIIFSFLASPRAFTGDTEVHSIIADRVHLGVPDATGRQHPQIVDGGHFTLEADLVIKALGFDPEDLPTLFEEPQLPVTRWGTIATDPFTKATTLPGVFAAGDIVRGAALVVWAIRDGRDAAEAIHTYLAAAPSVAAAAE